MLSSGRVSGCVLVDYSFCNTRVSYRFDRQLAAFGRARVGKDTREEPWAGKEHAQRASTSFQSHACDDRGKADVCITKVGRPRYNPGELAQPQVHLHKDTITPSRIRHAAAPQSPFQRLQSSAACYHPPSGNVRCTTGTPTLSH